MPAPTSTTNGPNPANSPTIPYIVSWSAEKPPAKRLTLAPGGRGIAYEDELTHDRDAHGMLWRRSTLRPGQGRPLFGRVHTARQRRTMRQLLCQICGGPADRTDQGVLWLLGDHHEDWAAGRRRWALPIPRLPELRCPVDRAVPLPAADGLRRGTGPKPCPGRRPGRALRTLTARTRRHRPRDHRLE